MKRRIFLFFALLSGLSVIVTSILITVLAYDNFFAMIKRDVRAQAAYIRSGVENEGAAYLAGLEHEFGHRLTVIAPDGSVLFDSVKEPDQMENHLDRPEIRAALETGSGESTRYSETFRERTFYYALRLADGTVLRTSSTTASVLASYDQLFWLVAVIAAVVFICTAAIASLVTGRIVRRINAIDLDRPENSQVYDELAPLLTRIREQRNQIREQMLELDRGRREFAAITQNMREGFLVLDREGRVLSYNGSALNLLNIDGDVAKDANILELNRSEPFRRAVSMALDGKTGEQIIALSGRVCQLYASPVALGGEVQGLVLLLLDVTEKQEREKLRREFTSNVSHELKTPLTAISGYAEIMTNGVAKPEDTREFSRYIYEEAQRLIALVQDMMLLSKLDEGAVQPGLEPVELLRLSEAVATRLRPRAEGRGIAISLAGEEAKIMGIPSLLDEMIFNLLDNAIKYNRDGGEILLHVQKSAHQVLLSVSDTGIGIPKAEQGRVFERFYRVDKSHNESKQGTGLGLAIVKHSAMLHHGTVRLESIPEIGTAITVGFPPLK